MKVDVLHCPQHGFGVGISGQRVLGGSCCRTQQVVASWPVTKQVIFDIRRALARVKFPRPALPPKQP